MKHFRLLNTMYQFISFPYDICCAMTRVLQDINFNLIKHKFTVFWIIQKNQSDKTGFWFTECTWPRFLWIKTGKRKGVWSTRSKFTHAAFEWFWNSFLLPVFQDNEISNYHGANILAIKERVKFSKTLRSSDWELV